MSRDCICAKPIIWTKSHCYIMIKIKIKKEKKKKNLSGCNLSLHNWKSLCKTLIPHPLSYVKFIIYLVILTQNFHPFYLIKML